MSGTVIDIPGITVGVVPIDLEHSTDQAHTVTISDGSRVITLQITYGKITQIYNECLTGKE